MIKNFVVLLVIIHCYKNITANAVPAAVNNCPCMQQTTIAPLNQTMVQWCNILTFLNDNGNGILLNTNTALSNICSQYPISTQYTVCLRTAVSNCFNPSEQSYQFQFKLSWLNYSSIYYTYCYNYSYSNLSQKNLSLGKIVTASTPTLRSEWTLI